MTNFDLLMQCKTPEEFISRYKFFNHGCRQKGTKEEQIKAHKELCLTKYRGKEGCRNCIIEFWNMEYKGE